jgi:hypothetical protein
MSPLLNPALAVGYQRRVRKSNHVQSTLTRVEPPYSRYARSADQRGLLNP